MISRMTSHRLLFSECQANLKNSYTADAYFGHTHPSSLPSSPAAHSARPSACSLGDGGEWCMQTGQGLLGRRSGLRAWAVDTEDDGGDGFRAGLGTLKLLDGLSLD